MGFEDGLRYVQTMTVFYLVVLVATLVAIGFTLKWLVYNRMLLAENALKIIGFISQVVGGLLGSVGILVVLFIIWPAVSDWIVNVFLNTSTIWQAEFQSWLTKQMADSRTATATGLMLKSVQLGSAALGYIFGHMMRGIFSAVLGRSFHNRIYVASVAEKDRRT